MKIKNESQRVFCFNGGSVAPGKVVDIQDRKIAEALIKGYPNELFCLETAEVEVIPAVKVVEEVPAEEPAEEPVKVGKRGKKAKSK